MFFSSSLEPCNPRLACINWRQCKTFDYTDGGGIRCQLEEIRHIHLLEVFGLDLDVAESLLMILRHWTEEKEEVVD